MKKIIFISIFCWFSQLSVAEDSVEQINTYLERCKLVSKESICVKEAQDRLSVLIKKQKAELEAAKAKVIGWEYETSEDKLRGIQHFSAGKFSNEATGKKEDGVLRISLNSDKQEILFLFLNRKFDCSATCYVSYKFDDGKIKRIPVHVNRDRVSLTIYNGNDVKEFIKGLKENNHLIIEVPADIGNMQFEFSLKPNLEWSHF